MTNALLSQQVGNQTTNLNYDLDGNLKNDSKFHYVFDAFQRIVEVKDQSQNLVAKYQMDTSNRRISKTVGTTVHRTVYAGWQIAEEHEREPSGNAFIREFKVFIDID